MHRHSTSGMMQVWLVAKGYDKLVCPSRAFVVRFVPTTLAEVGRRPQIEVRRVLFLSHDRAGTLLMVVGSKRRWCLVFFRCCVGPIFSIATEWDNFDHLFTYEPRNHTSSLAEPWPTQKLRSGLLWFVHSSLMEFQIWFEMVDGHASLCSCCSVNVSNVLLFHDTSVSHISERSSRIFGFMVSISD